MVSPNITTRIQCENIMPPKVEEIDVNEMS